MRALGFLFISTAAAAVQRRADEASYRFVGRVNPATKELTWPSSGVAFTFTGTTASIAISNVTGSTSVDLIIDGGDPVVILNVNGTAISTPKLSKGTHTVELRKRSETYFGTFRIGGVTTDGTLVASPAPKRKIEIIGDSISVGYGLDGVLPCSNTAALEDNPKTYGAVAAKALGADYSVVAWSGKGLIRNYAQSPPDTSPAMPEMYTRYGANDASNSFTFPSSWIPDAVVINLGTNDFSYLNVRSPVDPQALTSAVVSLAQTIRKHYTNTTILLMTSPMLSDNYPTAADAQKSTQKRMLVEAATKLGDAAASTYVVDWPTQGSVVGCDYHPNADTHAQGADILQTALKAKLGW